MSPHTPGPMIPRTVAVFIGIQHGLGDSFALYNLLIDIPGHPKDSTVTEATIQAYVQEDRHEEDAPDHRL